MGKELIILIGGGGHCKSVIDVIEGQNLYEIAGIVDFPARIGEKVFNYNIIGGDNDLPELVKNFKHFHITVGQIRTPESRIRIFNELVNLGANLPVIFSPYAYVSSHATVGIGTSILHNAIVNAGAKIGMNCIINTKALIEHDVVIGNHCHISTGAIVNGGVQIGDNVFFGSGAVSKQYIFIQSNSFVKANSLIK